MDRAERTIDRTDVDPSRVVGSVRLDLEGRRKRRHVVRRLDGADVLIDLAEVPTLADGDGLVLADGRIIRIEALSEALMEVSAEDERRRLEIAWHLGNRHLPVQFVGTAIRLRADHVIEAMLRGLGAQVRHLEAPFDPEPGAYGHHHHGGDGHGHG